MVTVALCIICHERPAELHDALASRGEGFDEVLVLDMASNPPLLPVDGVSWQRSDENTGVSAGRNALAARATSDVLVFLDDDAVFTSPPAAGLAAMFADDPRLGAVAFKVCRPTGAIESSEFPFRGRPRDVDAPRPCAYFVGAGYAVRQQALQKAGGYDSSFFYSTEEIDLSFKLAGLGWTLQYEPTVTVEHRPSTRGRSIRPQVPAMRMRNRIVFVRRHLPWPIALVHLVAWAARTLREAASSRTLSPWLRSFGEGMRVPVERHPLRVATLWQLHQRGGRVLW